MENEIQIGDTVLIQGYFKVNEKTMNINAEILNVYEEGYLVELLTERNYVNSDDKKTVIPKEYCFLIKKYKPVSKIVKNYTKTITNFKEVWVSQYNETLIDKWYNSYCKRKGRLRDGK